MSVDMVCGGAWRVVAWCLWPWYVKVCTVVRCTRRKGLMYNEYMNYTALQYVFLISN